MALPNSEEVGGFQKLILKSPLAFTAAIFCIAFGSIYFLFIQKANDSEKVWKELYEKEKDKNDAFKMELFIKAGVIEKQKEVLKKADSTLKDNVDDKVQKLIKNEINK